MFCSNCGKEIPENNNFCHFCGTKNNVTTTDEVIVDASQVIEPEIPVNTDQEVIDVQPEKPKPKNSGFGIAAIICSAIALVLAITCCGAFLAILPAVLGIIFGIVSLKKSSSKTLSAVSIILGVAALILSIIDISIFISIMNSSEYDIFLDEFYDQFENGYNSYYYY